MCMMCDGYTYEQAIERTARLTEEHGWAIVGVDDTPSWAYTIGLTWRFDHPELVVVGGAMATMQGVLHRVVDRIQEGERFAAGSVVEGPESGSLRFGRVHEKNLLGEWLARWPAVARASGHGSTSLRALQVIVDCGRRCDACDAQVLLDRRCTRTFHTTVGRRRHRRR